MKFVLILAFLVDGQLLPGGKPQEFPDLESCKQELSQVHSGKLIGGRGVVGTCVEVR